MNWRIALPAVLMMAMAVAGCTDDGATWSLKGYQSYKETGRVIKLEASVEDIVQEVYPSQVAGVAGLEAKLWAFCFRPTDPNDAVSAAAIEYQTRLPGDSQHITTQGLDNDPTLKHECGVPGPTIRVTQGDRVVVHFCNNHFHAHTIHWHGQYVDWEDDGAPGVTQDSVKSGSCYTYDFVVKRAGTLWYHCHVDTSRHLNRGLYGAFIVEPQDKSYEPKDVSKEYVMVLGTMRRQELEGPLHSHPPGCNVSGTDGCQDPPLTVPVDTYLINGHSYPYTEMQPETLMKVSEGDRIRIRVINTGESFETMHLHGHDMLITHRDGNPINPAAQLLVDTFTIGPGERYDVVVDANNVGPWMFHTHVSEHERNDAQSNGGMHTMMVYNEFEAEHGSDHQFSNVLPGGQPFGADLSLPSDLQFTRATGMGTNLTSTAKFEFNVDLPCGLKAIQVSGTAKSPTDILQALNDITATIRDPEGQIVSGADGVTPIGQPEVGATSKMLWNVLGAGLRPVKAGTYTIEFSGRSADAVATVQVLVDYWESFEEATIYAHSFGLSPCPGYGG